MSVRAQFWVSGHRREWGKPGVMSRQEDLRLIIPPPPKCWSKCAIKILSNSKGTWGRQRQTGYAKYLPVQARAHWLRNILGKCAANPLSTPRPTRVRWWWTCHVIISSLWVAVSSLKWRVKLCYLSLPHVHSGSPWNGHLFGPNVLGWNSLCGSK